MIIAAAMFVIPWKMASTALIDAAMEITSGSCTEASLYKTSTGAQLAYLAKSVNEGNTYENTYFQLTADIDLGGKNGCR